MKRVAVLGAGLVGAGVALELADAGHEVDLFDRCAQPLSRASFCNEGKIHLGYVYALDQSEKTTRTMIRGAACFQPLLERWLGRGLLAAESSAPFLYAVPHDSMMSVDAIRAHFAAVSREVAAHAAPFPGSASAHAWRELERDEFDTLFDRREIATAFRTEEVAVNSPRLCAALRGVLAAAPRITPRLSSEITGVGATARGYQVAGQAPHGAFREDYDVVVNALWEQRLPVDAALGLDVSRPAVHRYKAGLRTRDAHTCAHLPSVTFLIGTYGDTVAYGDSAYVSWYPAGLLSQEVALRPARFEIPLDEADQHRIVSESLRNLRRLMPGAASCLDEASGWEVSGGYISAWGKTGIDDKGSELHLRHEVGVHSRGNYHSIDTGKFTLAPLFAAEASARILQT